MQLFYQENIEATTQNLLLTEDESRHISRTLRKVAGDILHFTNGSGLLATAQITDSNAKKCAVIITEVQYAPPLRPHIHIALSPTKNDARLEWFLEKATEIGINEITLLLCARTEKPHIKLPRLHNIMVSAMKQSGQYYLPVLNGVQSFDDFIAQNTGENKYIAHCMMGCKLSLTDAISQRKIDQPLVLMIGPEGDFGQMEIALATEKGYESVDLGRTRLRTETAALVGAALLRNLS
jgi:16S rRNA (uracil1498-N3)-methyltransferase